MIEKLLARSYRPLGNVTVQTFKERLYQKHEIRKPIKARDSGSPNRVRYKVGQLFRHKRFHYYAVIYGWDPQCSAEELWITQMRVDDLPRGRHQSFYHSLVSDGSKRYVAEENIAIVKDQPPDALMAIAGEFFKRWNDRNKGFVSNVLDEYPDD